MKVIRANKKLNKTNQGYTTVTLIPQDFTSPQEYKQFVAQHQGELNELHEYRFSKKQPTRNNEILAEICVLTLER